MSDELRAAVQRFLADVDSRHDTSGHPLKYVTHWGAVNELRAAFVATPAQPPADLKDREAQEVRAALVELVEAHDYVEADPMDDRDIPRSLLESARRALGSKT